MIETNEENGFPVGTKITSIDNKLIHEIAAKYSIFSEITHERQDWQHILDIASIIEIENLIGELQIIGYMEKGLNLIIIFLGLLNI